MQSLSINQSSSLVKLSLKDLPQFFYNFFDIIFSKNCKFFGTVLVVFLDPKLADHM